MKMSSLSDTRDTIDEIAKSIRQTEKKIKKMYDEASLEKPIENDIVLSLRNMSYNNIKEIIKKYKKEEESDE
jgi:hypothetical protein